MQIKEIKKLINTIKISKNVILEGVPGTGKTHIIKELAKQWKTHTGKDLAVGFTGQGKSAITLHPATSYEDFIEGLRPTVNQNQSKEFHAVDAYGQSSTNSFSNQAGFFKSLVNKAKENLDKDFLVLLDEINRCNIPKVMGDLLTIIERSKRAKQSVSLPSGEKFSVPPNIHLIATMNTTDRSVAPIDSALRRRFAFHRLWPIGFSDLEQTMTADEIAEQIYQAVADEYKRTYPQNNPGILSRFGSFIGISTEQTSEQADELPSEFLLSVKLWHQINQKLRDISLDALLGHSYLFELAKALVKVDQTKFYQRKLIIEHHWNRHILPQLADSLVNHGRLSDVGGYAFEQGDPSESVVLKVAASQEGQGYLKVPQISLTMSADNEEIESISRELRFDDMPAYVLELDRHVENFELTDYEEIHSIKDTELVPLRLKYNNFIKFMYLLAKIKSKKLELEQSDSTIDLLNKQSDRVSESLGYFGRSEKTGKLSINGSVKAHTFHYHKDSKWVDQTDSIEPWGATRSYDFDVFIDEAILGNPQRLTIIAKNKHQANFIQEDWDLLCAYLKGESKEYGLPKSSQPAYTLLQSHNLILEGVPGTGKTHAINEICQDWGKLSLELTGKKRKLADQYKGQGGAAITLHPASTYEDFIEGLRPNTDQAGFSVQPGFFVRACRAAVANPKEDFLILLDEINRCNIPKVMGDLLTTIESSKRASYDEEKKEWIPKQTITLPYSKKIFFVPDNIYVVATMNTSDRSVAPMDSALRRRFAFQRLWPLGFEPLNRRSEEEFINDLKREAALSQAFQITHLENSVKAWFLLNNKLKELGPDAMLGHSYLFDLAKDLKVDSTEAKAIVEHHWTKHIIPQVIDILVVNNQATKAEEYFIELEEAISLQFTKAANHLTLPTCIFSYQATGSES